MLFFAKDRKHMSGKAVIHYYLLFALSVVAFIVAINLTKTALWLGIALIAAVAVNLAGSIILFIGYRFGCTIAWITSAALTVFLVIFGIIDMNDGGGYVIEMDTAGIFFGVAVYSVILALTVRFGARKTYLK